MLEADLRKMDWGMRGILTILIISAGMVFFDYTTDDSNGEYEVTIKMDTVAVEKIPATDLMIVIFTVSATIAAISFSLNKFSRKGLGMDYPIKGKMTEILKDIQKGSRLLLIGTIICALLTGWIIGSADLLYKPFLAIGNVILFVYAIFGFMKEYHILSKLSDPLEIIKEETEHTINLLEGTRNE